MDNQENNSFVHDELPAVVEIIGITFRGSTKIYYFAANGNVAKDGDNAIVETARGLEYGKVSLVNSEVKREELVLPLKNVIRIADKNDDMRYEANREKEKEAFDICAQKILDHGLDMKLIDVEYTFDNSKLLFYFTSDDRVDFRELVKDLAGYFRTRIELRQIGIRDEAKIMGGLGICGRPFCCSTFLPDFVQVSIKMAKEQNLSLNSAKISGACGRLMCCLRYEYDTYQEEMRRMPKLDSTVITPDGTGVVTEVKPLENTVKVMLNDENEKQPKLYHLSVLKPFDKNAATALPASDETKEEVKETPSEKGKGRPERREERKKDEPKRKEEKRAEKVQAPASAEKEAVIEEASGEKESRSQKHNHNNRNRRGNGKGERQQEAKKPHEGELASVQNEQKGASEQSQRQQNQGGKHNQHNRQGRNRQQNQNREKNTGNAADKPLNQAPKNLPQNQTAPQEVKKPSETAKPEENGRKSYAPMPSNSIKKSNRSRFGQIRTKSDGAFDASKIEKIEKKDNSEKK